MQSVFRFALSAVSNRPHRGSDRGSLLELYRRRDEIDASRLPAWLLTVVRNKARNHWRRQQVEQRYSDELDAEPVNCRPSNAGSSRAQGLKPVHRTCLMLRYVHGMSRAEIAATTGSAAQVKGHLQYTLELLRRTYLKDRTA